MSTVPTCRHHVRPEDCGVPECRKIYALKEQLEAANKKGHEAVLLAMKHEDSAKRANAEVFRLAELLRKADPKWGSPMHLNEGE